VGLEVGKGVSACGGDSVGIGTRVGSVGAIVGAQGCEGFLGF
jgi:hypothetical protein